MQSLAASAAPGASVARLRALLDDGGAPLAPADLDDLLTTLLARKRAAERQGREADLRLLLQFLQHSRALKAARLAHINAQLASVEADLTTIATARGLEGLAGLEGVGGRLLLGGVPAKGGDAGDGDGGGALVGAAFKSMLKSA